ncbi:MAG: DUF1214 domain-containing protein, partial [Phenylobacterium sp.]
ITGSVDNAWQNALEDVGPAGVDKGAGGKYLILPPGYAEPAPAGYIPMPSETYRGFAILRSNPKGGSEAAVAAAVAYGKQVKIYPLAQAANPPQTVFVDLIDTLFDATIPYDARFFETLARFVDKEPWLTRDKAMIAPLRSLGIVKGARFEPDAKTRAAFDEAAAEAHAYLDMFYERVFEPPYFPGGCWAVPAIPEAVQGMSSNFADPDSYPIDERGAMYSMGYFSAKHLGAGQFYLIAIDDAGGQALDGAASYRLSVPPDAPVKLYWSATAYDRETHALIREVSRASRSSNSPELAANADGSCDLWFGPKPPAGKDGNWIPTRADGGFEVLFRLYGPEKPLFDKTWVLSDLVRVS